ncbi:MAG: glutathione S-transferase family protein [Hyphomicrobiaceae bacterium]
MILYTFGPAFGLPDPSPFVTKAEVLLKMAGVPYRTDTSGFRKAPKGKLPYIDDGGKIVADSTFIRLHLEERYGIDFDRSLSAQERAVAWAFEKLCEDHLYWAVVDSRWRDKANFDAGPRQFFSGAPAPVRPLAIAIVRRMVAKNLKAHGMGRHSTEDIVRLGVRAVDAIAYFLEQKPWLMGTEPCGADATVFAFVAGLLCPRFVTPIRTAAERHANLAAYRDRAMRIFFPELGKTG